MWIYHVQLSSLDHDIEVVADANPEEEYEREQNQTFLVFKRNEPYRLGNYPGYLPWRPTQSVHRSAAASMSCCWSGFAPPPSMMTDVFDDLA